MRACCCWGCCCGLKGTLACLQDAEDRGAPANITAAAAAVVLVVCSLIADETNKLTHTCSSAAATAAHHSCSLSLQAEHCFSVMTTKHLSVSTAEPAQKLLLNAHPEILVLECLLSCHALCGIIRQQSVQQRKPSI